MLGETFLWTFSYHPAMGKVKNRKIGVRSKIFLFSKAVKDYGNGHLVLTHQIGFSGFPRIFLLMLLTFFTVVLRTLDRGLIMSMEPI